MSNDTRSRRPVTGTRQRCANGVRQLTILIDARVQGAERPKPDFKRLRWTVLRIAVCDG